MPNLRNMFIFGQIGYVPTMNQVKKIQKRGRLEIYLKRDENGHTMVETIEGDIRRYKGLEFNPYCTSGDPSAMLAPKKRHIPFDRTENDP